MASKYTNLDGDDLDAFNEFLRTEGLTTSAGLLKIFREWRRLVAGARSVDRYSTLNPDQLSLILGEATEIKRAAKRCEMALMDPRPMLPDEISERKTLRDEVRTYLARAEQWQDGLIQTGKVITTPAPDLAVAQGLAKFSYKWTGGNTDKYREMVWSYLRIYIVIPSAPAAVPKPAAPSAARQGPSQ